MSERFKATHDEVACYIEDWGGTSVDAARSICWNKIKAELEVLETNKNTPKEYRKLLECMIAITDLVRP